MKDIKAGFEDFLDEATPGVPSHQDLHLAIESLADMISTLREDLAHIASLAVKRDTVIEHIHLAVNQHSSKLDSLLAWKASMRAIAGQ